MRKHAMICLGAMALTLIALPRNAQAFTVDDFVTVTDPGSALFFEFCVIEGDGLPNAPQAELDALDFGLAVTLDGGKMIFEFLNFSTVSSSIADIYFDDSGVALIGNGSVSSVVGTNVQFQIGPGAPPNLPAGNNLTPAFNANTALSAHTPNQPSQKGINPGEHLILSYDYLSTPELVGEALLDGTLRVGLHVQSIGQSGESDAFIMKPYEDPDTPQVPVPEPATVVLLGMGTGFLALRKRVRR